MRVKEMTACMYPGETFSSRCPDCTECIKCEKIQHDTCHEENKIINNSVVLDDKENRIICSLPLKEGWQEMISNTSTQAKFRIRKEVQKLSRLPKQRDELAEAFKKLNTLGFIRKYNELTKDERDIVYGQQHRNLLPVSITYKPDSLSTTVRLCMDASAKAAGKLSLNNCLYKELQALAWATLSPDGTKCRNSLRLVKVLPITLRLRTEAIFQCTGKIYFATIYS